ncbi:hypothetical protein ACQEVF_38290 [Nonomuraea polychroma]|uniref:hypothetical protein n=1 Tax=Nonomuraea polychroma TaxID=46176 RepID=UPI003D93EC59
MTTVDELETKYGHTWVIDTWPGGVAATRRAKYTQAMYNQGLSYGFVARDLEELATKIADDEALHAQMCDTR